MKTTNFQELAKRFPPHFMLEPLSLHLHVRLRYYCNSIIHKLAKSYGKQSMLHALSLPSYHLACGSYTTSIMNPTDTFTRHSSHHNYIAPCRQEYPGQLDWLAQPRPWILVPRETLRIGYYPKYARTVCCVFSGSDARRVFASIPELVTSRFAAPTMRSAVVPANVSASRACAINAKHLAACVMTAGFCLIPVRKHFTPDAWHLLFNQLCKE